MPYEIFTGADASSPHRHHFWFAIQDLSTGQWRSWVYVGVGSFNELPLLIRAKAETDPTITTASWNNGMIFHQRA